MPQTPNISPHTPRVPPTVAFIYNNNSQYASIVARPNIKHNKLRHSLPRSNTKLEAWQPRSSWHQVRTWFVENFRNYCNTTALHGFNYMMRPDMSRAEHIFWIFIIIVSIIVSIVLVIVSWLWSQQTPTVTVIESSHFPTWNVPFPAVTICNFNKISKTKAISLAKELKRPPSLSESDLLHLFHITMYFSFASNHSVEDFNNFEELLELNNLTLQQVSARITPNCMEMISKCIWKGDNARCDSLFQTVNTAEGTCCTFNYYGTPTNNFPRKIAYQIPKQPYRVTGCGYPTGLSVLLNPLHEDYFGTYFSSYGFRLLIHDSHNFPSENAETKIITSTRESFVRINPRSSYATSDIREMAVSLRECLFWNERKLDVLQRYSFINCMSECRVHLLYKRCGCVPANLPTNETLPTCTVKQIQCITENREIFARALPDYDRTLSLVRDTRVFPCNCLPNCETNEYPSEITMGRLNVKLDIYNTDNETKSDDNNILLHVFFSDLMSTRYRKELFQNWLSALASFGGLLGLIMGFSIVSAFEFLYFLTFRPIFNLCAE